jgi:hypothetical protein
MEHELNSGRDAEEDALRDAGHDAFTAFWRSGDTAAADELWLRYCTAQASYEAYLGAPRSTADHSAPRPMQSCSIEAASSAPRD